MGAANSAHWFHPWMYTCTVQTADPNWFWLLSLLLSSEVGFPLYMSTADGRATAHQFYCFAIEVGLGCQWGKGLSSIPTYQFKDIWNIQLVFPKVNCVWIICYSSVQMLWPFWDLNNIFLNISLSWLIIKPFSNSDKNFLSYLVIKLVSILV